MRVRTAVLGASALLLAAGCGTTETGTSAPTTAAAPPPDPFNVCEDLPDAALATAGLNPATKSTVTNAPSGPTSWIVCAWEPTQPPATYRVEVYSTSHTMDETRKNENLTDLAEVEIAGREGLTFREKNTADTRCRAAFGAEQGSFIVSTAWFETGTKPDLCGLAVQYLTDLEPALPD